MLTAAFLSLLLSQSPSGGPAERMSEATGREVRQARVEIEGNIVLQDEVYLAVLAAGREAPATEQGAAQVERALAEFLNRSGYELASVRARLDGDVIRVLVREGRLEKIVFRGRLTVKTLRFKLALSVPYDVFHRPDLDRQMEALTRELKIERAWYALVPSQVVPHTGPQLEQVPALRGYEFIHEREPFELHIFFAERDWDVGPGMDLRSSYTEGIELGPNWQGQGLVFDTDRLRVAGSGGLGLRRRISDNEFYPAFSRAYGEARWFAPAIAGKLRPNVWLQYELVSRQRADLGLESYSVSLGDAALYFGLEATRSLHFELGGGFEWRRQFGFRTSPGIVLPTQSLFLERARPFAHVRAEVIFEQSAERWDRRHAFAFDVQQRFGVNDPWFGSARVDYQRVIPFGWHDLWLKGRGLWHWGEVPFHDERAMGELLHGIFGDEFVRRAASVTAEYRFSLTRDVLKLSFFHDLSAYGHVERAEDVDSLRFANAFGPGLHVLFEGMLQLDLYLTFGFDSARRFDTNVIALLLKVF